MTVGKNFNGSFEGNGHTISGLYLSSGNIGLGLFGFTGAGSSIQNLKLANSYFCGTSTGYVELGAIAGRGLGNVSNVYVSNDVYMDCHGYYCGGIVGRNPFGANKVYSKCWFAGNIDMQATGRQGGGILGSIGIATLSMNECLFTGTITTANNTAGPQVGGLIGQVSAAVSLTDCLSGGKVTSTGSPNTYGSVFGYTAAVAISLTDVYEADDDCPYVIGKNGDKGTKTGSIITRDRYSLLGYGGYYELGSVFDFTNTWIAVQGSVPQLKGWGQTALDLTAGSIDTTWSGAGTSESPYLITSVNELFGLATMAKSTDYTGTYFKLTQSLAVNSGDSDTWNKNVSGIQYPWTPIGRNTATPFSGIFDGNNCTISGLYTDSKTGAWIGLFGKTGTGFAVRNVALTNSYLSCGTGVSGIAYIGSIVGECYGSVDNVYSDATIVSAGKDCGGIVGRINGTDTKSFGRCWYNGNITTSGNQCGGLIGNVIMGTLNMTNCVNTGVVTSIYTVTNNEQPRVGALIGMAWEPSSDTIINITDTIAAGTVSEQCYAGGIGTIAGYTSGAVELNYNDVYACQDTYGYAIGRTSDSTVITGVVIPSSKTDRFIGYCYDATENDGLDFTNIWAVRSEAGVPVIANFASVAGITTVATGNLDTQTGLDSLGLSLANAENYGEGNYLLTVADDSSATKHNTYKSELERLGLSVYVDNLSALGTGGVYNRILKNSDNSLTVNLTYVARKATTYISISSGKPLSSHLMPLTSTSNKYNVSFAMLPVYEPKDTLALGNAFVMQLKNGHFIVNDGGYALNDNIVVEYMQSKVSAGETPIVDAWFLSHLHGDHSMIFNGLRADKDLRESIRIEGIYFSMPNNDVIYNTDKAISGTEHCAAMIEAMKAGMQMMKTSDGDATPLYRIQTGHRYYFDGVTTDVVLAQEQLPRSTYDDEVEAGVGDFNTTSAVLLFTTDTNQKIFIAGDAHFVNTNYIMTAYGSSCPDILSDINVFVAMHHGHNTVNAFTNWVKPTGKFDYVLFPSLNTISVLKGGTIDRIDTNANKTLCDKANNAYSYSDGLSTILTFTSSGITATRK